jgi:plastocyanin
MKTAVSAILMLLTISLFYGCKKSETATIPVLTTTTVSGITSTTASGGGNITDDSGADITSKGVCWGTTTSPTTAGSHSSDGAGKGVFVSNLTGLSASTTYYVRAYANNSAGTAYGNEVTFTTTSAVGLPTLTTTVISAITSTTATSGGDITNDNGADIIAKGVCWSTTTGPTIDGSHSSDGTGTGVFASSLTALTAGTMYYVRAFATNSAGTDYGNEVTFTTTSAVGLPTLTTTVISAITSTTATSGGDITNDNGFDITAKGVCWSTTTGPTIAGSHSSEGTGTGVFASSLTELSASTMYYVRAYAINSAGTAYGNEVSFTTSAVAISQISIVGFAFSPQSLTISVNTTVKWTNNDGMTHDVTSNNSAFTNSGAMADGTSYSFKFTVAGIYMYHCSIHPSMTGTITVQ